MIAAYVDDLFFRAKIEAAAQQVQAKVKFLTADESDEDASFIIIDLNNKADPVALARKLKERNIPVIGFLSHVQTDLMHEAKAAGCVVMTRSEFSRKLPQVLRGEIA